MKKYVNGEYIEMTEDEVVAWEESQKAAEDSEGGRLSENSDNLT